MSRSLPDRLESGDQTATVTALPDGSVDRFYEVFDGERRVRSREAFGEAITTGHSPAFSVRRTSVEPGGHAVNMAEQAGLLGNDVTLVGHLDDPVFEEFPVETLSMGDPASVGVYGFDDGDVLLADPPEGVAEWSLADLRTAVGDRFDALLSADAVFWTNWTTFDATPEALSELAGSDLDGNYLVFDPGSLSARSPAAMDRLVDALTDLGDAYDVVLAVNAGEARALADGIAAESAPEELSDVTAFLREAAALAGAVVHEAEATVAATPDGRVRVENVAVDPVRHTGGGDRFDAGLAHALARGWGWEDALRLGNACASRYIATGESATPEELATFVRERE
ncbi:carbohydrate kinase family protein [Halosimplex aquaticum]|uniref:Carbohydrate kinase family protein n=1 Tax=Halosimplex aquaticum TaxID=3026162 RepID=A0ABD5XX41_9EURY|nr:carbohydrate kinase family protein [Halosimplex aquaticum]